MLEKRTEVPTEYADKGGKGGLLGEVIFEHRCTGDIGVTQAKIIEDEHSKQKGYYA